MITDWLTIACLIGYGELMLVLLLHKAGHTGEGRYPSINFFTSPSVDGCRIKSGMTNCIVSK
ncbi:MAG: hypothetical protein COA47_15060 [Robiginitomaculum sp.]|nr:MAG: hypothetical protein COA47_15060 [Robiginitomaculum sp.]